MARQRHTEEQIIGILKKVDSGIRPKEVCREHGISEPTYYKWKSKYGGMMVSDVSRLRAYEVGNGRLKKLVANQALDNQILKEVIEEKL